jgi:hypothetical protein
MEEKKIKELEKELREVDERRKEILKEMADLRAKIATEKYKDKVGECYKHPNYYCGSPRSEHWYIYSRITGISGIDSLGDPIYVTESIQKTCDGRIEYNPNNHETMNSNDVGGWIKISFEEFMKARTEILCLT